MVLSHGFVFIHCIRPIVFVLPMVLDFSSHLYKENLLHLYLVRILERIRLHFFWPFILIEVLDIFGLESCGLIYSLGKIVRRLFYYCLSKVVDVHFHFD